MGIRKFISSMGGLGIVLAATFAPEFVPSCIKSALFYLGILLILISLVSCIVGLLTSKKATDKQQQKGAKLSTLNPNITKINQEKLPNKFPIWLDIIALTLWLVMFIAGIDIISLITRGLVNINIPIWQWVYLILLFYIFPILVWINTLIWDKKYKRIGESFVAKKTSLTFCGSNVDEIFKKVFAVLVKLDADAPMQMLKPKLLIVPLKGSLFTVRIRHMRGDIFKVDALSDSQFVTTKIDSGRNKKNIDDFKRLILEEEKINNGTVAFKASKGSEIKITSSKVHGYPEVAFSDEQSKIEFDDSDIKRHNNSEHDSE